MGTRHLVAVVKDGTHKIAQYGQWDGYPSGQGRTVLEFCRTADWPAFAAAVDRCRFMTDDERAATWTELGIKVRDGGWVGMEDAERHKARWPELSRDTGAEILQMVADAPDGLALTDNWAFAADGLFCEYAYVIDLDAGRLEAYRGFGKEPLEAGQRFAGIGQVAQYEGHVPEYYPVRMVASWPLAELPSFQDFERAIDGDGEEGEE